MLRLRFRWEAFIVATTIKQSFAEFRSNLELTDRQTTTVSDRRANVVKAVKEKLSLHQEESRVIGSWDRDTITRYLSEGDVDVMVVLHYTNNKQYNTADGAVAVLDRFKSILDGTYPATAKRRDQNCISMKFSEFRLDVVPAFKWDAGYYTIPDSVRKVWLRTDPIEFASRITATNKTMGNSLVPLIKMVKGWNRDVGWPIRSFHLECMMLQRYAPYEEGYTYSSMLRYFFAALPGLLRSACYDPVSGDRVDGYLDNAVVKTRRTIAIEKAQKASAAATEAHEDEEKYPPVAIKEWKALLGEFFPAYG